MFMFILEALSWRSIRIYVGLRASRFVGRASQH
jgi:hypothetical protein